MRNLVKILLLIIRENFIKHQYNERRTMNNKLTYTNYNGCKDIIAIDLHNDYTVIAIKSYNPDDHAYIVEFHLKEKTTDMWQLIQDATTTFNTDHKSINGAILKHVATLFADGFYDYFIERYEYELKCFDVGNDVLSKEEELKTI